MMRFVVALSLLCLAAVEAFAAPTAVIAVKTEAWMQTNINNGNYGGLSATKGLCPFPVFFEMWESTPSPGSSIASWMIDFGDGTPPRDGFVNAHVYETPGVYTATVTVTDADGTTDTDSIVIEVLTRVGAGITYYVDSDNGNDSNNGTSLQTAWRTATKAYTMTNLTARCTVEFQGDRVLPYDLDTGIMMSTGNKYSILWTSNPGCTNLPVIRRWDNPAKTLAQQGGVNITWSNNTFYFTNSKLKFIGYSTNNVIGHVHNILGTGMGHLFLRCGVYDAYQAIVYNIGVPEGSNEYSGAFVFYCDFNDYATYETLSPNLVLYFHCKRAAMVGNTIDKIGNHICYGSWMDGGYFYNNVMSRPAFGRTALRVAGATGDLERPSRNVWIDNNQFLGWIDPLDSGSTGAHNGGGVRYNTILCNVATQTTINQRITNVRVQNNLYTNFEMALSISASEDVLIQNNTFTTPDAYTGNPLPRVRVGGDFERIPCQRVTFKNNIFQTNELRALGGARNGSIFQLRYYNPANAPYGVDKHTDIKFINNLIQPLNGWDGSLVWFGYTVGEEVPQAVYAQLTHYNILTQSPYMDRNAVRGIRLGGTSAIVGGTGAVPGVYKTINEWYTLTGNEDPNGSSPPPVVPLTLTPDTQVVASTATTTTFSVVTTAPWTVSDDAAWATVTPSSGTGNATLTVSCTANPGLGSRSATVTVAGTGTTPTTESSVVVQMAPDPGPNPGVRVPLRP